MRRPVAKGRNSPPLLPFSLHRWRWGKLFPRRATAASSGNFPSDLFYDPFHAAAAAAAATANEEEGVDFDRRRGKEAEKSACTNPQYTARFTSPYLNLPTSPLEYGKANTLASYGLALGLAQLRQCPQRQRSVARAMLPKNH